MGKTQTEKRLERQLKYNKNPKQYDFSSSISIAILASVIEEVEKANEVFPEIFTHDLVKNINRCINFIHNKKYEESLAISDEQLNLMKPFLNLIKTMRDNSLSVTDKVSYDDAASLNYGESIMIDDIHELYHYCEEDIIVINRLEGDDHTEIFQVMVDYENLRLTFETL